MTNLPKLINYDIKQILGQGGMATVYLAEHILLKQSRAIKLMAAEMSQDNLLEARFIREGQIITRLQHPHIVTIYDIGLSDAGYFMVMEYLSGGSLKDKIKQKGRLSQEESLSIARQMGSALDYAHQQGVIHRDVKPANILFRENDIAVLSDFGVSKQRDYAGDLTRVGYTMLGTPRYMSPEQITAMPVDGRSDLYSLALIFYEMLTGKTAIQGDTTVQIMREHTLEPSPTLPSPYQHFQAVLNKALAKQAEDRYASAGQFIDALETAAKTSSEEDTIIMDRGALVTSAKFESDLQSKKIKQKSWSYIVASLGILLVLVSGGLWWWHTMPISKTPVEQNNLHPVVNVESDNKYSEPLIHPTSPNEHQAIIPKKPVEASSVKSETLAPAINVNPQSLSLKNQQPLEPQSSSSYEGNAAKLDDQTPISSTTLVNTHVSRTADFVRLAAKKPYITLYDSFTENRSSLALVPTGSELRVLNTLKDSEGIEWYEAEFEGKKGFVKVTQTKPK
ncbi:serine/threonine-protein kinase [Thiolinea disciformis]|uniref:serine/threonine-protein kinase n=1 Tax=Thiolinea disciformis TaxID=125614 RepID=UPI00038042BF|nr:serine/threonine-protein kinase [Thiolinea disciformis]